MFLIIISDFCFVFLNKFVDQDCKEQFGTTVWASYSLSSIKLVLSLTYSWNWWSFKPFSEHEHFTVFSGTFVAKENPIIVANLSATYYTKIKIFYTLNVSHIYSSVSSFPHVLDNFIINWLIRANQKNEPIFQTPDNSSLLMDVSSNCF